MAQIGAHISAAGGLTQALIRAEELGIRTMQIFGSSPRQWQVCEPKKEDISSYRLKQEERLVEPVFLHAPYLVNLATNNYEIREKSINALIDHLRIAELIKAQGLVFHAGSSHGSKKEALERIAQGMLRILEEVQGSTQLILENSAGGGNKIGISPAEIGFVVQSANHKRISVCFDTAHAFEAGVFHFAPNRMGRYLEDWEDKLGLDCISLIHANDSATDFNSGRDLHANIGEGRIGLEGFRSLARQSELNKLPWILEVPGFDNQGPDRRNVEILENCFC